MMQAATGKPINTPQQVLFASLIGTTIEFFDFYIYALAASLVFPRLFFAAKDPTSAMLDSFATFGIAFLARPIGSALFGHFGDRIGRKRTLVAALLTMGISTFIIGILPGYAAIGILAPLLLALCRFGQGIGLGGEWGGAVLLAVENAPPGKRALYGMFPQLGAPIGYILSGGIFLLLTQTLTDQQFFSWGWRLSFLASSVLVLLGLYVRLTITETPVFAAALKEHKPEATPMLAVFARYWWRVTIGAFACMATFVLFYLMTVFSLSWAVKSLHYSKATFIILQLVGMLFFGATIPLTSWLAERGRKPVMIAVTISIALYGLAYGPLFSAGSTSVIVMLCLGLALMGMTYGPIGTVVSELFPTPVRYTGSSLAFSLGGILGASATPAIALKLATAHGINYVGYYLSASAVLSFLGLLSIRETKDDNLATSITQ